MKLMISVKVIPILAAALLAPLVILAQNVESTQAKGGLARPRTVVFL